MPSSHSPPATRVASDSIAAEPREASAQGASPDTKPGLVRRALLKLVVLAERDTRGQGSEPGLDLSARPEAPPFEVAQQVGDKRRLSLALQGGGVFGAFTWGVLDRLLEEDDLELDAVSGASAGAINAVLLASGLAQGGPDEARASLERFWSSVSESTARNLCLPRQRADWRVDPERSSLKAKWLYHSAGVVRAESITRQRLCPSLSHVLHVFCALPTNLSARLHEAASIS